jgi:hypothetical protein
MGDVYACIRVYVRFVYKQLHTSRPLAEQVDAIALRILSNFIQ